MTNPAPLGAPRAWVRDLALIGAASALAPAAVVHDVFPVFVAATAVAGAASGAALGALFPRLLLGPFSRLPIALMLVVGLLIGASWGGLVGAAAGLAEGILADAPGLGLDTATLAGLGGTFGAVAGAVQLGWFWLPYTLRRARGRAAWPVVVAATGSLALGWIALLLCDAVL